jgi:hypothetical protein
MEQSESDYARVNTVSLEEIRRQARENWLQYRQNLLIEAPRTIRAMLWTTSSMISV